jgi:hypothetical protein
MVWAAIRKANENVEDYLFHYTTVNGLVGIVSSGHLRATHHGYMNDKTELKYGFREFSRIASTVLDEQLANANSRIRKLAERGFVYTDTAKAWSDIVEHFIVSALGCYLFCLCAHGRKMSFEHGLLSQWRCYGSDGGYALRFRKDRLSEYLKETDGPLDVKLEPVIYGIDPVSRSVSPELKANISEKLLHWCEHPIGGKETVNIGDFVDLAHVAEILNYVVFTKNEHFVEENEWRICAIRKGSAALSAESYFLRDGTIVPCVELRSKLNIKDCMDQVIVGPHAEQDERCSSTLNFLRSKGCDAAVVPTDIPLRAS